MAELAYLQVARVCNQRCVFCSNPANGRVITWKEAKSLVDGFAKKGFAGLILTGGEPTLFKDLPRLVTYALSKGLEPRLITNGQKTADRGLLEELRAAGLRRLHVSVHSPSAEKQAAFSRNPRSLANISRTLDHAARLDLRVDVNTTINRRNAGELYALVRWLTRGWPQLRHFVWNNLDPLMNRASLDLSLVPRLRDFEVDLHLAMSFLDSTGRTFRVDRVPLCFMSDFPHRSTETRKIVKEEARSVYFLDQKGLQDQDRRHWTYGKSKRCSTCGLDPVCAGLYQMDVYYSSNELCPSFLSPEEVRRRVVEDRDN
ncbi:MAG: radical SAM protein [Elusimicrobia bacterium]|nr:radical SAM protein [Elusimicrobiota bacterium]